MKNFDKSLLKIHENGHILDFNKIAVSKLFEIISVYMLGTFNSILLSGYSKEAVAISNISVQIINLAMIFLQMTATGASILISISLGEKNEKRVGDIAGTTIITSFAASLITSIGIIAFAKQLLILMNVEAYMMDATITYLTISAAFLPIIVVLRCCNSHLICYGYSMQTLIAGIIYNVFNILFCYIILYSPIDFFLPKITMVAFGTGLAYIIGMVIEIILIKIKKCAFSFRWSKKLTIQILKMGIPGGTNYFMYTLAQTITTSFIVLLGISVFNTKVYISNIIVYSSAISLAIAQTNAIFTGRYKGSKNFDAIDSLHKYNMRKAVTANAIVSAVIYLFHIQLLGMFTSDRSIIALAGKILLIDILIEFIRAVNQVSDQALNANGDVKTTFAVSVSACWIFGVFMSYILSIKSGLGLVGVWFAFTLEESFKAVLYSIRWKSGKWKTV